MRAQVRRGGGTLRRPVLDTREHHDASASGVGVGTLRRPVLDTREHHDARRPAWGGTLRRPVLDTREHPVRVRQAWGRNSATSCSDTRAPRCECVRRAELCDVLFWIREHHDASASGVGWRLRRPVLDTREHHGASASGVGWAPRNLRLDVTIGSIHVHDCSADARGAAAAQARMAESARARIARLPAPQDADA